MSAAFRFSGAALLSSLLIGCGALFPGFDGAEQPLLYEIGVSEVATQISCELREFFFQEYIRVNSLKDHHTWSIDDAPAKVTLTVTTDINGKVGYLGINLNKLGLGSLSQLTTLTSQSVVTSTSSTSIKVPSLQASLTGKRTVSAQVVLSIPQRPGDDDLKKFKAAVRQNMVERFDKADAERMAIFAVSGCPEWARHPDKKLFIASWMKHYFEKINAPPNCADNALLTFADGGQTCITGNQSYQTVTLSTGFQIAFDVSGGLSPFAGGGFIIPVSAVNFDFNPDFQHKLDIQLTVCGPLEKNCEPTQKKLGSPSEIRV
jgi:hypothetical protein